MLNKEEKIDIINLKIIKLNQKKETINMFLSEDNFEGKVSLMSTELQDIEAQIQTLTNLLEMI